MLITVSGIVGSGKSTAAKQAFELLQREGLNVEYLRFRSIGVLPRRRRVGSPDGVGAAPADGSVRRTGYRQRPLTAIIACGYLARILSFRMFRRRSRRHIVCDRYFYDSLVHYTIRTRAERCYVTLLRHVMPRPDLSVLLLASEDTIARRRPEYSSEYITSAGRAYEALAVHFPELVTIRTDTTDSGVDQIVEFLRACVAPPVLDARDAATTRHGSHLRSLWW